MDKVERLKKQRDGLGEEWNLLYEQIKKLRKTLIHQSENNLFFVENISSVVYRRQIQHKEKELASLEQQMLRLEKEIEFFSAKKQDADNTELIKPLVLEPVIRNQVFISYSHQDQNWFTKLKTHLKSNPDLVVWDDTKIVPGAEWRKEIENALAVAKVAVLLVSPDFLASDFIAENELPSLLNAAKTEGLIIIWILLSFSGYEGTEIEKYQAAHSLHQPLDSLNESELNGVLVDICKQIKKAVNPQQNM